MKKHYLQKALKTIADTGNEGLALNVDLSFDQHQVKVVEMHQNQKFEMLLAVVL